MTGMLGGLGGLPPGLQGFVLADQMRGQKEAQQLNMLGSLAQLQGNVAQQQMLPLQMQKMRTEMEASQATAEERARIRALTPQLSAAFQSGDRNQILGILSQINPTAAAQYGIPKPKENQIVPPGSTVLGSDNKPVFTAPFKDPNPSELTRLIAERDALPPGDPRRQIYDTMITHKTNPQSQRIIIPPQPPAPQIIQTEQGTFAIDRPGAQARPVTLPNGQPMPGKTAKPLSATAQKELFSADAAADGARQAIDLLKQAQNLNDGAMGFMGAGAVATAGTLLPEALRPKTVDATLELDNLVTNSAVPQLKSIFGSNPTEGERRILLDIAGSSSKPPAVRKGIFERAIKAAESRMKFNERKAESLRGGEFFTPQATPQVAPEVAPQVSIQDAAKAELERRRGMKR